MRRRVFARAVFLVLVAGLLGSAPARASVRSARLVQKGVDFAGGRLAVGLSVRADGIHASREASYVSPALDAGLTFSAIGPHWQGAPDVELELSVSPDNVHWGGWIAVPREGTIEAEREDGEPNPFAGESIGALVFVAPESRYVRYRARLHGTPPDEAGLRKISFHVIDPGASSAGTPPAPPDEPAAAPETPDAPDPVRSSARRAFVPPPEIPVPVPRVRPEIWRRAAWGARPPRTGYAYTLAGHVGFHHTATVEDWSAETWAECAARLRAIQTYHMDTNGWNDVGYAYVICRHGHIFQAREDDDDTSDVQGAHDGYNKGSTGISLFGYFHPPVNHQPTEPQVRALVDLISWIVSLRGIDPLGRSVYEAVGAPVDNVYGHREVKATDCPGDHLFALKELIRTSVSDRTFQLLY
jgi:hypothetical protein